MDAMTLKRITAMHADEIHDAISSVVDGGWYLRGEATERFEHHYAEYIGTKHCIGVANGLDALTLILRAYIEMGRIKEGDEVIVPANTYIATILSITENRLVPVLVEPSIDILQIDDTLIEQAITPRTRAVMIVHLYGRCAFTNRIADICKRHNLLLIEDNAQAHGTQFCAGRNSLAAKPDTQFCAGRNSLAAKPDTQFCAGRNSIAAKTGSLGNAAAHSFYPGKNLGALGDGGAVTTDDPELANLIRSIANYGSSRKYVFDHIGRNSRLDELQAAVLDVKLKYLDQDNRRRCNIAHYYLQNITLQGVKLPITSDSVFHIMPMLCQQRDKLQHYLTDNGIQTIIHYPIPPHKQACYPQWNKLALPVTERIHSEELSLPCHQAMTDEEVQQVVEVINAFRTQ